jgi:hypothetical protein
MSRVSDRRTLPHSQGCELGWASSGLTDIHHQGHRPGKDVQNGDHGTEEAPSS